MTIFFVWLVAYLITGFRYVRRDLKEPMWNRPPYTQTSFGRWRARLAWLLLVIVMPIGTYSQTGRIDRLYLTKDVVPSILTFLALGALGTWINSN